MVKKCAYFKGFTLAEVMIVLTVIGVLTAILLPVARQSMPDRDLMKFKKAHNTLGTVIRELVTSDKYYKDGDLGVKIDGTLLSLSDVTDVDTIESFKKYFCETFAQVVNAKKVECSLVETFASLDCVDVRGGHNGYGLTLSEAKLDIDDTCKKASAIGAEIVFQDDVVFYQVSPKATFGWVFSGNGRRFFGASPDEAAHRDKNGFGAVYKIVCIDIDGMPSNVTENDCINECPFGYGIRADGKILTGKRADEWLARDVNEE